jgi:PAS domain S-box-containing protein
MSAMVSGGLALYAWRRRYVQGGAELALLMLAVAVWSLCAAIEGISTGRFPKIFWSAASYLGSQTTPLLFLVFVLRYTQQDKWLTPRRIALLAVIPFVSILMAFTNGLHGLLWPHITMTRTWAGVTDVYAHGPWFWVSIVYNYTLVLVGIAALLRAILQLPHLYSRQARLLLLATLIPLAGNIVYAFSPHSVEGLDITPVAFTLTGLLVASALFRYRLLDLRPIARNVLFDGIRDGIVAVDSGDRVVDINPIAEDLIGVESADVIGKPAEEVLAPVPELVERIARGAADDQVEIEVKRPDGDRYYDVRTWPLRDRKKRLLGEVFTLHDITELKLAQRELERINAELDGYAHTVSHDLKGPLTGIGLANETLQRLIKDPETPERNENIQRLLSILSTSTLKAASLIEGLLTLAVAGQKPVAISVVRLEEVIEYIREETRGEIEQRGVRLETGELDSVRADPTHVYQLFSNLIHNAIQHNDNPRPVVEVRLVGSTNGFHRYLVRDNGSGIPPADLDRIFTPFFKGETTGSTGIGLSTARRIVEVYGGEIHAYNDNGANFEFTLRDYVRE